MKTAKQSGLQDLSLLTEQLKPMVSDTKYVFCHLHNDRLLSEESMLRISWAIIREDEGVTVILSQSDADNYALSYDGLWRRITCTVHSSLYAVGLTALISTQLANNGISANIVAGYFHDHIFVGEHKAQRAREILSELSHGE